jgi:hypothetical protein
MTRLCGLLATCTSPSMFTRGIAISGYEFRPPLPPLPSLRLQFTGAERRWRWEGEPSCRASAQPARCFSTDRFCGRAYFTNATPSALLHHMAHGVGTRNYKQVIDQARDGCGITKSSVRRKVIRALATEVKIVGCVDI